MLAAHQGRLEEAETSLRKALAMFRRLHDPSHTSNQNALRNLGLVIIARGRVAEGLALLDSALVQAGQSGYINGQRVPALLRMGRLAEAEAALAAAEASFNGEGLQARPRRLDVAGWAGAVALAQGDAPQAAAHFAIALNGYRALYSPTHHKVSGSECGLGIALATEHRFEEAAPLLENGCPIYERWGLADPLLVEWGRRAVQDVAAGKLVALRVKGREEVR
jgi:tetratricopeptide (TPR) repeat protein